MQVEREKVVKLRKDSRRAEGFAGLLGPWFNKNISGGAVLVFFFLSFLFFESVILQVCVTVRTICKYT